MNSLKKILVRISAAFRPKKRERSKDQLHHAAAAANFFRKKKTETEDSREDRGSFDGK